MNPLFTNYLDYPDGINLMWQTSVPLLGLLMWPVTATLGPIFSYNLVMTASVALSAFCGFLACRRHVSQAWPAAVGAVITWQAGGVKRSRLKTSGGSYLASHDPRELLGLGAAKQIDSLEISWPSGKIDKLTNLPVNRYLKVVEGAGLAKSANASVK